MMLCGVVCKHFLHSLIPSFRQSVLYKFITQLKIKVMKIELGFLELNALVYALHLKIEEEKKNVEKYGGDYFKNELKRSEELYTKIGEALWTEIGSVGDFLEKLKEEKIESLL